MAYPGLKFVYNGADSNGIYVEIEDKANYFGLDYVEFDVSFPGYDGYKQVPNTEEGDTRDASFTYDDYFERSEYYYYKRTKEELKEDFLKEFENNLVKTLYDASESFHSYSIGDDYDKIYGFKNCLKSAKKDVDMDSLIKGRNERILYAIKGNLEYHFKFQNLEGEENPGDFYIDSVSGDAHAYRELNEINYGNFNIKNYIRNKGPENIDEIIDIIKNAKDYFN